MMNMDARVFISYSSKDLEIVQEIWRRIENDINLSCWIDLEGIEASQKYIERIISAIDHSDIVLFMLSDNALKSEYTQKEILYAKTLGKKVVPVVIDGGKLRGWFLFEFGNIDYIDISKQERYQKLLKNLNSWLNATSPIQNVSVQKNKMDSIMKPLHSKHRYIDLGLPSGTLWATCNIGADTPYESGDYFAWGETSPKEYFDSDNYKFLISGNIVRRKHVKLSKYVLRSKYGEVDNKIELDFSDDAARVNWGENWRMPSIDEWHELRRECHLSWEAINGKEGCKFTGKNGKFIFLPACGNFHLAEISWKDTCSYWSSSLDTTCVSGAHAHNVDLSRATYFTLTDYKYSAYRVVGMPVRAVTSNGITEKTCL